VTHTIAADWLGAGPLPRLLAVLNGGGEETRVVGGAVRNALLGEAVAEFDLATTAVPDEVVRRVEAAGFKAVPTGIKHGTLTVVVDSQPFEVTTLRTDVETFGRHATVAFGRDWKADAERRDFTMNALSLGADGTLYDYIGGREDIAARRVRFIGDPAARIAEDYLRILRFFRFHAAYGEGEPDAAGLAACTQARAGLDQLSRERVRMELLKLLAARRAGDALASMLNAGILVQVLGGVPLLANFAAMVAEEQTLGLAPDPIRRLGALAVLVVEDAERLWERLRLANSEHARLLSMADGWWRIAPGDEREGRALLYRLGPEKFLDRVLKGWAHAPIGAANVAWRILAALPQRWTAPVFPLRAKDFVSRGVPKGPELGQALRAAEEAWVAADFPSDIKAIESIATRTAGPRSPGDGPHFKATRYFEEQVLRKRPYIKREWCLDALAAPVRRQVQVDGRIRIWGRIEASGEHRVRFLRVVLLADGETIHNAFFDRNFREDQT
jgi:tRNA nucleotidyltransferase/poly(A) polymerase